MDAYYYCISDATDSSVVDEGIIRNSEDMIFPGQNTGLSDLPSEVECHHFKVPGYKITGWTITLNRDIVRRLRS